MPARLATLDEIKAHLAASGENVESRKLGAAVPASFGEKYRSGWVDIVWQARPGVVQFYLVLPFDVPEDKRTAVGLVFLDLNARLVAGGFLLTPLPAFTLSVFLDHDGTISDQVLERAIGACRDAGSRYVDAIAAAVLPRPKPAPHAALAGTRVTLSPEELARLSHAIERDWPLFAPRLSGPLLVTERAQPWFRRHRILEVQSPAPLPPATLHVAVAPSGELRILRGHLENLVQVAIDDPPADLDREDMAVAYAEICGGWTSDAEYGELRLDKLEDIPWRGELSRDEQSQARDLRLKLDGAVHPPRVIKTPRGYTVKSWALSNRRLIYRELHVPPSGQMLRDERVWAENLGVHPGRTWALVSGRWIPTG